MSHLYSQKNKEQKIQEDENYVSSLQKIYKAGRL